ncbi:MAG: glycosyltransferase [Chloroflexota bacterium]|nr:MAG: hypothetical protein DIU68_05405 [Chloroflexota bacterium]
MRILYLTNGFPYPLTSGYLRHYFLIRELAPHHKITLLSVVAPDFAPEHVQALAPYTERVLTFTEQTRRRSSARARLARKARSLFGASAAIRQMRATIQELLRTEHFDALFFSGKETYGAIEGLSLPPMVADLCDATSMRLHRQLQVASPWKRPLLMLEYRKIRDAERKIIRDARFALFASARDREMLIPEPSEKALVVPNGVDAEFWKRTTSTLGHQTIVFTGAMNYAPNADAALVLMREIFPAVRQRYPQAQLYIVGHSPRPQVVEAGRQPGVTVTGFVDDVRCYLDKATVFAAPLRFGAGIQNKLLEAMAMEVPVIGSPLAVEGLRTSEGHVPPVQVAESAADFIDAICRRFEAAERDATPDAAARRYVEEHFVWRQSGLKLIQVMEALAG